MRAINIDGSPVEHAKTDNTGYSFLGRSYGVGGSVGLLPVPHNVSTYSFLEYGYLTRVQCWVNSTANMTLGFVDSKNSPVGDGPSSPVLSTWLPQGYLPNTGLTLQQNYLIPSFSETIVSILAGFGDDRYIWGLVAGNSYEMFRNTTCEVFFDPTRFLVSVDSVVRTIIVTPILDPLLFDIDESGLLNAISFIILVSCKLDRNPQRHHICVTFKQIAHYSISACLYKLIRRPF
jgi:hypothetical protein